MSNRLLYIPQYFHLKADQPLVQQPSPKMRDNAAFLAEVAKELQQEQIPNDDSEPYHSPTGDMAIGLMGSYGLAGYGLRRSQEILRVDRGPSYWSHAFLFAGALVADAKVLRGPRSPWLLECTMAPSEAFSDALYRDGVMPRRLAEYMPASFDWRRRLSVPNMAVISVALSKPEREAIRQAALAPEMSRQSLALGSLAGKWFSYLSDPAEVQNPLLQGYPMHSAAYVHMAYSAALIDLAPGASQNAVAPEYFWSLGKRLGELSLYRDQQTQTLKQRSIRMWSCVRDPFCTITGADSAAANKAPTLASIVGASEG